MTTENGDASWQRYQKLVVGELGRLNDGLERIEKEITDLKVAIAMLQVKAGVWGLIGGAIPVAISLGVWLVMRG